ncbi:hypothetical protein MBO83_005258, partial [Klebsiella pneumoniae]
KDRLSRWAQGLLERRGHNRACVALANKLARVIWVIMARNERYRVQLYEVKQLIRKKTNR